MTRQPMLRFGIAGLGQAAASMLPEMAAHPHIAVTAAADLRPEARKLFAAEFEGQAFERVEELCASDEVDAIYVATPHQFHAPHSLMALRAGKHVILEKPMALTIEDCDAMIETADRNGVQLLVGRGSHGFDPAVLKMREIVMSGELGRLAMINTWQYGDFLYRPRTPEELDTALGGGVIFNQGPHQIDLVRVLGGGLVRSVRAMTGIWDEARRSEGAFLAYLEFENGIAASIMYSGYDHFDADELHWWIGTYGAQKSPNRQGRSRRALLERGLTPEQEAALKASAGYGGSAPRSAEGGAPSEHQIHWGITIASCERGDLRQSPDGILIYGDEGLREVEVPKPRGLRGGVLDELYEAAVNGRPLLRDGRWEKGTLEVCLAILQSTRERREIMMQHQTPLREA